MDCSLLLQLVICFFPQLCDTFLLRPLLNNIDDCLTLTLSVGSLKGGGENDI